MSKILLNNQEYTPTEGDLPCLIYYKEKQGGTSYTIAIVASLFNTGSRILFLTAYPMARDDFYNEVGQSNPNTVLVTSFEEMYSVKDTQCIILESGNEELFLQCVEKCPELLDRVILIKNIEKFSQKIFNATIHCQRIIYSGNLDECVSQELIFNKKYSSVVFFSKPGISIPFELPELKKYSGYLCNDNKKGIVKLNAS